MSWSSVGQLFLEARLLGAQEHDGAELLAVLVGLFVHVDERVDRFGSLAVGVEDHGVDR